MTDIDQAQWRRYATSNKDRCMVCGHQAVVSVVLTASPMTKGGAPLARNQWLFCDEHGLLRFGEARIRLNGGQVPAKGSN